MLHKPTMQWHQLNIPDVLKILDSRDEGLSAAEAAEKLKRTGPNELQEGKKKSIAKMLLSQFKDVMILILLIAAIISDFLGDFTDTIVIIVIVLLNALLGFFQEYRADKAMQALKKMSVTQVRTLRNHQITVLPATQLVPGDIILLEAGNAVPADIRVMESIHLETEEAALTGEFHPVNKTTKPLDAAGLPAGDYQLEVMAAAASRPSGATTSDHFRIEPGSGPALPRHMSLTGG